MKNDEMVTDANMLVRQSNRKIDRGGKTCYSVLQQVLD